MAVPVLLIVPDCHARIIHHEAVIVTLQIAEYHVGLFARQGYALRQSSRHKLPGLGDPDPPLCLLSNLKRTVQPANGLLFLLELFGPGITELSTATHVPSFCTRNNPCGTNSLDTFFR